MVCYPCLSYVSIIISFLLYSVFWLVCNQSKFLLQPDFTLDTIQVALVTRDSIEKYNVNFFTSKLSSKKLALMLPTTKLSVVTLL